MDNKEQYRLFCESGEYDIPLFLQYWWMETVCAGKSWDVALVCNEGHLVGAMPYLYGKKYGMTYILQPQLTQFSGPFFAYPQNLDDAERVAFEHKVADNLISQMETIRPSFSIQHFSPAVTNWLPFYWRGYCQSTRYTYRLEDISNIEQLFSRFDRVERQKKVLRYEPLTKVTFDMSAAEFAQFHHDYWRSKGEGDILSKEFIVRVCSTAIEKGHGVIASLRDLDGNLLASRFVVFDSQCAYSLMSALAPERYRNGYTETLVWGVLRYLSGKTHAYDFEGSMDKGIEHFYRSYGAVQTPFFEVYKYSNRLIGLLLGNKLHNHDNAR